MKKDFMPTAVVVRMREIKKSVYDNKRDSALSQIDDMIKQITDHDTHCERCGGYLSEVDYHCGGELCEPCCSVVYPE